MGLQEMSREARQQTMHLLIIRPLTPWRIAWGLFTVQVAEIALFVSLTVAFLVFSYLFRGVGWTLVLRALSWVVLFALNINALALMVGSFRLQTWFDGIARGTLAVLIVGFITAFIAIPITGALGTSLGAGAATASAVTSCLFFLADNLTHRHPLTPSVPPQRWEGDAW